MKQKQHFFLLGGHMSISGGLEQSLIQAASINCLAVQLFTKSNRQWAAKHITDDQAQLFKTTTKELNIKSIVVHASYLINLGSADALVAEKSVQAVITELERCAQLDIPYLILHPGSYAGSNENTCLQTIASRLNHIFKQTSGNTCRLLLENMAGQGSVICSTFEQIAAIIEQIDHKDRIGVCFDTCHAFAAGYHFDTPSTYTTLWDKFDQTIGLKYLKAFHINNSKTDCGSHVDRHAELADGRIKLEAFKLLFNDARFFDTPKILETPLGFEGYPQNIELIKTLISTENKRLLNIEL